MERIDISDAFCNGLKELQKFPLEEMGLGMHISYRGISFPLPR